ncbi:MAG: DUF3109 family protein [Chloroherpetonaceae bacterium]|nr:DUF3109 family protein [Chloroherpetonaceae bacterium]MDW8437430.1 DUF3109 family protein [Chloroherpetonaceae bacterium]
MVVIDGVIVGDDVFEAEFRCDLARCKGACCVVGELGAPVSSEEVRIIESILDAVKPYLPEANRKAIERQGVCETHFGELFLATVEGRECAFATIDENGVATCNLERAYLDGKTTFRKPLSCHLFPIRVRKRLGMDALVYMRIDECEAGRRCGAKEKIKLGDFLAPALERKYGKQWLAAFLDECRKRQKTKDK